MDPDVDDKTLSETHDPATERDEAPGSVSTTWFGRVLRREDRHKEKSDDRVDKVWEKALATAESHNRSAWWTIRFQWIVIVILVLTVVGLAGYSVGFNLPGIGEATIGK